MVERARTKDESFMLRLYEEASKQSALEEASFDRYQIGQAVGLQPKAVDTICTLLGQANFIKKRGKSEISITPHGVKLIERLQNSS